MDLIPVASSDLAAVGYDEANQWLEIRFNDGSLYRYFGVPKAEYQGLMAAASKGSYLAQNIKGVYEYARL